MVAEISLRWFEGKAEMNPNCGNVATQVPKMELQPALKRSPLPHRAVARDDSDKAEDEQTDADIFKGSHAVLPLASLAKVATLLRQEFAPSVESSIFLRPAV
jgi:hypothetical protein